MMHLAATRAPRPVSRGVGYLPTAPVRNPQIGEPITIAASITAVIAWAVSGAVAIGAALGISAAVATAIATSLILSGIYATSAAVKSLIDEMLEGESDAADWVSNFYSETWDHEYTSEDAVRAFMAGLKKRHGRAGEMAGIKVWARWITLHAHAPILVRAGIVASKQDVIALWTLMQRNDTADAKYAAGFYSENWQAEYTSEEAVLAFIRGMQERHGARAGAMCGIKVMAFWKNILEPKLAAQALDQEANYQQIVASSTNKFARFFTEGAATQTALGGQIKVSSRMRDQLLKVTETMIHPPPLDERVRETSNVKASLLSTTQGKVAAVGAAGVVALIVRAVVR